MDKSNWLFREDEKRESSGESAGLKAQEEGGRKEENTPEEEGGKEESVENGDRGTDQKDGNEESGVH